MRKKNDSLLAGANLSRRWFLQCVSVAALGSPLSARAALSSLSTSESDAVLLVVDVQNCFLPGGTLAFSDSDQIIPVINALGKKFHNVVFSQDWHTPGHASFASSHPGKEAFETIELPYGSQVLWPDHCVQGTHDAQLSDSLDIPHAQLIIRKGYHQKVDSYSTFAEADGITKTGLTGYLQERGLKNVYVCGLATDFCVSWSAQDAARAGLTVSVIADACRGIDLNGSVAAAWKSMADAGVARIQSSDIA